MSEPAPDERPDEPSGLKAALAKIEESASDNDMDRLALLAIMAASRVPGYRVEMARILAELESRGHNVDGFVQAALALNAANEELLGRLQSVLKDRAELKTVARGIEIVREKLGQEGLDKMIEGARLYSEDCFSGYLEDLSQESREQFLRVFRAVRDGQLTDEAFTSELKALTKPLADKGLCPTFEGAVFSGFIVEEDGISLTLADACTARACFELCSFRRTGIVRDLDDETTPREE